MQDFEEFPTIRSLESFDPVRDALVLRKAMKGMRTDENAIINVLARRTNEERQQISQAFENGYERDLIKDLKAELDDRVKDVIMILMTPRYEYVAQTLEKAIRLRTKEKTLVDIFCTARNQDIILFNKAYEQLFGRKLAKDLGENTSVWFHRLLVSLNKARRDENPDPNPDIASQDAQDLFQAGENRWKTDESTFNVLLSARSFPQLRLMFEAYESLIDNSFENAIEDEFSGDAKNSMLAVVKSARNPAAYFAERLHECFNGIGSKDDDLIFIIVTRAEIDLENIKDEYQRMFGTSLASDVCGDSRGDYQKILLTLLDV